MRRPAGLAKRLEADWAGMGEMPGLEEEGEEEGQACQSSLAVPRVCLGRERKASFFVLGWLQRLSRESAAEASPDGTTNILIGTTGDRGSVRGAAASSSVLSSDRLQPDWLGAAWIWPAGLADLPGESRSVLLSHSRRRRIAEGGAAPIRLSGSPPASHLGQQRRRSESCDASASLDAALARRRARRWWSTASEVCGRARPAVRRSSWQLTRSRAVLQAALQRWVVWAK